MTRKGNFEPFLAGLCPFIGFHCFHFRAFFSHLFSQLFGRFSISVISQSYKSKSHIQGQFLKLEIETFLLTPRFMGLMNFKCLKPHKKSHPFWRWYTLKKVMICSLDNNTKNAPRIAPYGTRSTKYEFSIILTPLLCNYVTSLVSMVRVIWYVYVAISCVQILHWD